MELMKDYEYVIDSHAGKANVVVDIYNRKSSSFAQIWAIQTSMRNELRSLPIELTIDEDNHFVVHLKVRLIHLDKIRETKNNDPTMVKLKNYIDSWIILRIEDRLDFWFMKILEISMDC